MINFPAGSRIWLVAGVTDMRCSFNGLAVKVQNTLRTDPFSGHLFIFRGRRGDMIKVLWADRDGLCLFTKRLEQWDALNLFCGNGWAEIDNNIAENALHGVALGRKNWLFAGSDSGGERAAVLYSLTGTCRLNGVAPETWLRYVLTHIQNWPVNRVRDGRSISQSRSLPGGFMTGVRDGPRFSFLSFSRRGRHQPAPGRLPCCTHPNFSFAQVRKPDAAIVVAAQALPELEPYVAQLRGPGVSPQMQSIKARSVLHSVKPYRPSLPARPLRVCI